MTRNDKRAEKNTCVLKRLLRYFSQHLLTGCVFLPLNGCETRTDEAAWNIL